MLPRFSECRHWLLVVGLLFASGLYPGHSAPARPGPVVVRMKPGPGPNRRIDSLRALLQHHRRPDTVRVKLLFELVDEVEEYDARAVGPMARELVRLNRQLHARDFLAEALLVEADYHITQANYDSAVYCLGLSKSEFTRLRDRGGQMRCLGRRARIADQQGHYALALAYALAGMNIGATGDERRFHTSLSIQVGSIYSRIGEYQLARNYLLSALQVVNLWDYPDRLNLVLGELGELSRRQQQWPEARRYYAQSRAVSQQLGHQSDVLLMDLNLAEMNEQLRDYAAAQASGYGILRRAGAAHQQLLLPRVLALLARVSLHAGRPDSAVWYGTRSLRLSEQSRSQDGIRVASAALAAAYARRGNFAQAYRAQQRFAAYTDSLGGAELARRTAALQYAHERRQQRASLQLLGQQQELERLRQQRRQGLLVGLVLAVALGGAALLWAYRQRQRRHETALRNRLAADLHDDVGTLLSQISLQSSLLREGMTDSVGQRQQLSQISEASRSAVRQLNDVVWSLDAHNDHLPDLLDRMRDYAADVLGAAGLDVNFAFPPELPTQRLPPLLRRNLYLIFKESLHNAVKHATGATAVDVGVRLEPGSPVQLVLEIADNGTGVGLAPGLLTGHVRRSGHGLRNIQERAQALGGAASSGGGPTGFRVRVAVPLLSGWNAQ